MRYAFRAFINFFKTNDTEKASLNLIRGGQREWKDETK